MKIHKNQENNKNLGELYYYVGNQATNFRIFHNYIDEDGEKNFSAWVYYLDANEEAIDKATHRTLLKNEIVLDFDPAKGETKEILRKRVKIFCDVLDKNNVFYNCYDTGSRGYHVHIFYSKMLMWGREKRRSFRKNIMEMFCPSSELQKNSEGTAIAIEDVPHWKTGKIKKRVNL